MQIIYYLFIGMACGLAVGPAADLLVYWCGGTSGVLNVESVAVEFGVALLALLLAFLAKSGKER